MSFVVRMYKKIVSIDILDRLPSSDHLPLYVMLEFNCEHMMAAKHVYSKQAKLTCNWSKVDSIEIDQYKTLTKELLTPERPSIEILIKKHFL